MLNYIKHLWSSSPESQLQVYVMQRKLMLLLGAILLAKSQLGLHYIGQFEQLIFVGTVFSAFWLDALLRSALSYVGGKSEEELADFIKSLMRSVTWFVLVILTCLVIAYIPIVQFFKLYTSFTYYVIFFCAYFFNIPVFIIVYALYIQKNSASLVKINQLTMLTGVLPFVLVFLYPKFNIFIISLCVSACIQMVYALIVYGRFNIQGRFVSLDFIKYFIPLMLYGLINQLSVQIDAWLVNDLYKDPAQFAVFKYGIREIPIVQVWAYSITTAAIVPIATHLTNGLCWLKHKVNILVMVCFPIVGIAILTSKFWFPVIFNEQFSASVPLFNTILLLVLSYTLYPHSIFLAKKENGLLLKVTFIENVLNVVVSYILLYKIGILGVGIATVGSYIFEKVTLAIIAYHKYGIKPNAYLPVLRYTILAIFVLACYVASYFI